MLLKGYLDNMPMVMLSIYPPNANQRTFYEELINKLHSEMYCELLLMGDFSGVMDTNLDKSKETWASKILSYLAA